MRRRSVVVLMSFAILAAAALPVRAQAPGKIYRVAVLATSFPLSVLRRGFIEGRNLIFELHVGAPELLPDMARGLVEGRPDMIFAVGLPPARAARAATVKMRSDSWI